MKTHGEDYVGRTTWLLNLASKIPNRPLRVLEIGVWKADFADQVLSTISNVMILWTGIDPYEFYEAKARQVRSQAEWDGIYDRVKKKMDKWGNKFVLHRNRSSHIHSAIGEIDFLFIDGNHGYDDVSNDLKLYAPKVKVSGIISGHDYQIDTVKKAVDRYAKKVKRRINIDEFREGKIFWWEQSTTSLKNSKKIA